MLPSKSVSVTARVPVVSSIAPPARLAMLPVNVLEAMSTAPLAENTAPPEPVPLVAVLPEKVVSRMSSAPPSL